MWLHMVQLLDLFSPINFIIHYDLSFSLYFGSLLSIYGWYQYHTISNYDSNVQHVRIDTEQGYYMPLTYGKSANVLRKASNPQEKYYVAQAAGVTSYLFQVIFQVNSLPK